MKTNNFPKSLPKSLTKMPTFRMELNLSDDKLDELSKSMQHKLRRALQDRADRDDYIRMWHQQYDAIRIPKDFPWRGASSLNIPTTRALVDAVHARMMRAITGTNPYFKVESMNQGDIESAQAVEKLIQWQSVNQINIRSKWDELLMCACKDGNAIVEVPWRKEWRRVRDVEPVLYDPNTGKPTEDASIGKIKMGNDGQPIMQLVEEDRLWINQPDVRVIDALNWFMYPANSLTVESAIGCGYRFWATRNDLMIGVRDGHYIKDQVEKLVKSGSSGVSLRDDESNGGDPLIADFVGVSASAPSDPSDGQYQLFRITWLYDYDEDGIEENCQFVMDYNTGIILQANIYPYWHGRRNFINYCPYPRKGAFYGYSLPEIIQHLHAERNAIRNQRIDVGSLLLSPMLAVGKGARFVQESHKWTPGGVIKADDVSQIKPISLGAVTQGAFAEEQKTQEMVEDVSGLSAYAAGQSPSRSRTLGEINSVLAEGNMKFDVVVARIQDSNSELVEQMLELDYQYLDPTTEFAITGGQGTTIFASVTRDQMLKRYRIVAAGNSINSNKELLIQIAETLYTISQSNPLMNKDLTRVWAVSNFYLQQAGIMDPTAYIGTQEQASQMQAQAMQAPPEAPMNPISLSGKLDEISTLALLFKADPSITQNIQQAMQVYAAAATQIQGHIQQGVAKGISDASSASGWNQQDPGGLPAIPTDPNKPGIPPGMADNQNVLGMLMSSILAGQNNGAQPQQGQ